MKENLLLLHGALGSQQQFDPLKEKLAPHFEVHALNFEGHGGRAASRAFSMDLFAENVHDYLQTHDLHQVTIFGHSMGGYVALWAALQAPARMAKIFTLGTKFNWTLESAEQEVKLLNPAKIEAKVPHFAAQLQATHAPQDWKWVLQQTADMMMGLAQGAALTDAALKHLQVPVVIGWGSLDRMVPQEESQQAAHALPQGQLVQLDGVKHPLDQVDPAVLAAHLLSH